MMEIPTEKLMLYVRNIHKWTMDDQMLLLENKKDEIN